MAHECFKLAEVAEAKSCSTWLFLYYFQIFLGLILKCIWGKAVFCLRYGITLSEKCLLCFFVCLWFFFFFLACRFCVAQYLVTYMQTLWLCSFLLWLCGPSDCRDILKTNNPMSHWKKVSYRLKKYSFPFHLY